MTDVVIAPDDNILLFTRATTGKEFSFYIRNIYIIEAANRNCSMIQYLTDYSKNLVKDPLALSGDTNIIRLYDLFDWSILEILDDIYPELAEEKPTDKLLQTRTAIIHIVRQLFAEYKIIREV